MVEDFLLTASDDLSDSVALEESLRLCETYLREARQRLDFEQVLVSKFEKCRQALLKSSNALWPA
jgi:hypothetical protein